MVAIVCHDAGGAELVCAWVRNQKEPYCLVLEGPAQQIFERNLRNIKLYNLQDAINLCDWVLCGTSWESTLELEAIRIARKYKKEVVSFIDHWVNYLERFNFNESLILPDKIWVGDFFAEKLAIKIFPNIKIELKENYYFKEVIAQFDRSRKNEISSRKIFLYICEPILEHALLQHGDAYYWGYTEFEALKYFLENIKIFSGEVDEIWIRPHPSECREKYNWAKSYKNLNIRISGDLQLFEEISNATVVLGCESMAMVVGLLAGKRVISSIPENGRPCSLPFNEIEKLHVLINKKNNL